MRTYDLDRWNELPPLVRKLAQEAGITTDPPTASFSEFLFRGHSNAEWSLETTLERQRPTLRILLDYYQAVMVAKTQIETFTSRSWPPLDYWTLSEELERYDTLRNGQLPAYDLLVYLRHHGFPSPLLDWTGSLYVAAFFAFRKPIADRVAIFVYQEYAGQGKASGSDKPQIHQFGPYVRSHPRHFLQQAEYTLCVEYLEGQWQVASHSSAFGVYGEDQDRLWKITLPRSEAEVVMRELEQYNITAFSLFQSEEALLETLSRKHLR